jgi:hypothetical protein
MARTLSTAEMFARAAEAFGCPPALARIRRPRPVGAFVAAFALPLEWLKPQNWARHRHQGTLAKLKDQIADRMAVQHPRRPSPLPGRPYVRCCRFSSAPRIDRNADTFKMAIDVLCAPEPGKHRRLNFIRDDSEADADISQWWEPAPRGEGFGYIEVYTGAPIAGRACHRKGCSTPAWRWYGWNAATPGKAPDMVRAPYCRAHGERLAAMPLTLVDQ